MAGQRKRKHAVLDETQSKQTANNTTPCGTKDFTNIAKPHAFDSSTKKRKIAHDQSAMAPQASHVSAVKKADKKRKRALESEEDDAPVATSEAQKVVLKNAVQSDTLTPRHKKSKLYQPPSPVETPSKDTIPLFDKLKLNAASQPIPFSFSTGPQVYGTPPDTPPASSYDAGHLPAELEDLLTLQAAFLSALTLYYAHNGTSSPVNIKSLLPMITKNWRKRTVSLDDLRMLLSISEGEPDFILQDFGRAGTCLTKSQPRGRAVKRAASFVHEVDLNAGFEAALQKRWSKWLLATPKENHDVAVFMDQLPLVEFTKHESVQHAAPLFSRGQQRLQDLNKSQAAANTPQALPNPVTAEQKTDAMLQSRSASLLDRILAKQAHAASLPAGPTRQQLERKAALQRIEEIERILDLLAAGRPRCSFSMPIMIQQLQQSLRNPISKEEVERCLELMATEITPGFVKLVRTGAVTGVVVTKGGKFGLAQLRQRVQSAGA